MFYTRDHGFTREPFSADSVAISETVHEQLVRAQSRGARIVPAPDDGAPTLVWPDGTTPVPEAAE